MEQVVASGNAFPFGWYSQEGKILIYTGIVDIFVGVKVRVEFYCRIYIEIKIERIVVTPVRQEALISAAWRPRSWSQARYSTP